MNGYIAPLYKLLETSNEEILVELKEMYPDSNISQVEAWKTLINDIKTSPIINELPKDLVIAIEYSLPTDGMAIDLLFAGLDINGKKTVIIVESKQWNNDYILKSTFSAYREQGNELNPQIQVSRHCLSFHDYLDIGSTYTVIPYVFIRNCGISGLDKIKSENPRPATKNVRITNNLDSIANFVLKSITASENKMIDELLNAAYLPSKEIIDAMKSIVTRDEPFILTEEQKNAVVNIKDAIKNGKKIIRVTGAAGSGKTAILLNLYVEYLNEAESSGLRPIFISGAQNTAYYRNLYPEVENSFTYSFSLQRMIAKTKGNLYVVFMDEAQHNQAGIISEAINRGATLVLCYDIAQTINANNSIQELKCIETRDDFITIELKDSVRFNGSQVAEKNIRSFLKGETERKPDKKFDFQVFDTFDSFQTAVKQLICENEDSTVAVTGLLSSDSELYTTEINPNSLFFTDWGYKTECKWLTYIREKAYLSKFGGKLWVGTWWMPGLDVDYICVIVGGDAILTCNGITARPEFSKLYQMIVSVADVLKFPSSLTVKKKNFGKESTDYVKSSKNIIDYIYQLNNEEIKGQFITLFSKLLRNNYYIMMSRGRKGCYVYFTNNTLKKE